MIAFTYFNGGGSDGGHHSSRRKYVEGIRGNLEAMALIYGPEWTMRLYHNLGENDIEELLPFIGSEKQFVLCDINRNPLLGNASILLPTLWRFLPLLDDQVLSSTASILASLCCLLTYVPTCLLGTSKVSFLFV